MQIDIADPDFRLQPNLVDPSLQEISIDEAATSCDEPQRAERVKGHCSLL